jgi:hypothetical protein
VIPGVEPDGVGGNGKTSWAITDDASHPTAARQARNCHRNEIIFLPLNDLDGRRTTEHYHHA